MTKHLHISKFIWLNRTVILKLYILVALITLEIKYECSHRLCHSAYKLWLNVKNDKLILRLVIFSKCEADFAFSFIFLKNACPAIPIKKTSIPNSLFKSQQVF